MIVIFVRMYTVDGSEEPSKVPDVTDAPDDFSHSSDIPTAGTSSAKCYCHRFNSFCRPILLADSDVILILSSAFSQVWSF